MPTGFQRRVLAERTRTLASRGVRDDDATLPPHWVCLAGGRHLALPAGMVSAMRPFTCFPVPLLRGRAAGVVLGLATIGRKLASVLELAALLGPGLGDEPGGPTAGGFMLLLRGIEPPVAVRVDDVLGVLPLFAAAEPGRALLRPAAADDAGDTLPPLAVLVEPGTLAAAIAALSDG